MARPNLFQHRKFRRLTRSLDGDAVRALGHLEFLWASAYEMGDDYVGDGTDVEASALWSGEAGRLVTALLDAGFLDPIEERPGHYRIHNLWDHAPEYVLRRMRREHERRDRGGGHRSLTDTCRSLTDQRSPDVGQRPVTDRQMSVTDRNSRSRSHPSTQTGTTPPPPSAAAPGVGGAPPAPDGAGGAGGRPATDPPRNSERFTEPIRLWTRYFERGFWPAFPRKVARQAALKAWLQLRPTRVEQFAPLARGIAHVLAERIRSEWRDRAIDRLPYPATFLRGEAFDPVYTGIGEDGDGHVG